MRWAGNVERMGKTRNGYMLFVKKVGGKDTTKEAKT
jgi:hypothetical protein